MAAVLEMLSYPFMVRALIGGILISLCASCLGAQPGIKTVFDDRRWAFPRILWSLVHRISDWLVSAEIVDPGGGAGGFFPSADYGKWKSQERRGQSP